MQIVFIIKAFFELVSAVGDGFLSLLFMGSFRSSFILNFSLLVLDTFRRSRIRLDLLVQ
jgi:hypothetical protein